MEFEEGQEVGYRTPLSTPVEENQDHVEEEEISLSAEALEEMSLKELQKLAEQEDLDVDFEALGDDAKYEIAKLLGFDVTEEEDDDGDEERKEKGEEEKALAERREELEREYSQKFRDLRAIKEKAKLVDLIEKDPHTILPQLAQRLGVQLFPQGERREEVKEWEALQPLADETMQQYLARSFKEMQKQLMGEMRQTKRPPQQQRQQQQQRGPDPAVMRVTQYLDRHHSDWGIYIDEIIEAVEMNPSLAQDPEKLYQVGKRMKEGVRQKEKVKRIAEKGTRTKTGERPTKVQKVTAGKKGILTFDQAWNRALRQAKERG